jgi:phytoene/squalene synthetase
VSKEAMIGEMRLQWWRDVVAEASPRAHEVAGPLHRLILEAGLPVAVLDAMAAARRRDCWGEPFENAEALRTYLEDTGAGLAWVAARALGAPGGAEGAVRAHGWATAAANYLRAVPALTERGRQALPEGLAPEALAREGLARLAAARAARASVPRSVAPALLAGWQAGGLLRLALREPGRVAAGTLALSGFARDGGLMWQALTGRW